MAIVNPVAYLQAGTYPAGLDRLHQISMRFLPTTLSTSDIACRGGVLGGQSARQFAFSMTNWDVTVGKGAGLVENTFTSQGGDYSVFNTANQVLTVTASSPTTNRIDIIGVRVQDAFYTGAINSGDLAIVQGTPAAGAPSAPALPASFLPLIQVTVNAATTTGVLTDLRKRTAIMGAVYQPFTAQIPDSGTAIGEIQLLPASGVYPARLRTWDGTVWRGAINYAFAPPAITNLASLAATAQHIAASLSVADPGFSYKLRTAGSLDWGMVNANQPDHPISLSVTLDNTAYNGGVISRGNMYSAAIAAANQPSSTVAAPAANTAAQTGAHTVRMIARNSSGSQPMIIFPLDTMNTSQLTVELVPA
jgi:hypothetical protein